MSLERFYVTATTLVLLTCLGTSVGWPFLEHTTVSSPRKFFKSSVVQAVSIVPKQHDAKNGVRASEVDNLPPSIGVNFYRLPPSPANLLKPDGFQFYTYNEKGDMITKQMTMQEIQSLIAAGGPDHSNMGIQEPQKAEDILTGGKKVMDVVEKVQSVLKSAMDKPSTLTGAIPNSVPEKVNVEWSNILPAILAGEKYPEKIDEPRPVEEATSSSTAWKDPFSDSMKLNVTGTVLSEPGEATESVEQKEEPIRHQNKTQKPSSTVTESTITYTEKLMIPVPVITAEHKPPTMYHTTQSSALFQKITEMVPLETGFGESPDHDKSPLLSSSVPTKDEDDSTLLASTMVTSKSSVTEETMRLPTTETKTKPVDTLVNESLDSDSTTKSVTDSDKTEAVANESFTTPSQFSSTFAPSTDKSAMESSTMTHDTITKLNTTEMEETQPIKPLSAELENSLSSMINQISEGLGSSVLPMSSELELPQEGIVDKHRNSSETQTSTTVSMIDTTKSTMQEEEPPNVESTIFKEPIQESTTKTTMNLKVEKDKVSTSTTPVEETMSYSDALTKSDDIRNATETTNLIPSTSSSETMSKITTFSPFDSPQTNATQTLNSESMAIIEGILQTISAETNSPVTEAVTMPNILPENLPTKTLASGLVAGFGTTESNASQDATTSLPDKLGSIDVTPCSKSTTSLKLETQTSTSILPTVETEEKSSSENQTQEANEDVLKVSQSPSLQEEPVILETTVRTVSVTPASVEYSQMENDEPSTVSKTTYSMSTTESSPVDVTSKVVTDRINSSSTDIVQSDDESTTMASNESFANTEVSSIRPDSQNQGQENVSSTEFVEVAPRPERIPPEALKKDDATLMTHSEEDVLGKPLSEPVDETVNDTIIAQDKLSTKGNESTVITNLLDTEKQSVGTSMTSSMDASTTEASLKEEVELQSNESKIDTTTFASIDKEPVTSAKEWSSTTSLPTISAEESYQNSNFSEANETDASTIKTNSTLEPGLSILDSLQANQTFKTESTDLPIVDTTVSNGTLNLNKSEESQENTIKPSNSTMELGLSNPHTTQANQTLENFGDSSSSKKPITSEEESTSTTTNLPSIGTKAPINASTSDISNESYESITNISDASMRPGIQAPQSPQANQMLGNVGDSTSSKVNGTDVDGEHKWQRISLHQTASPSSTKFAATKKPPGVSTILETTSTEAGTRFQTTTTAPLSEADTIVSLNASKSMNGLDTSTRNASIDIINFSRLCNELAFKFWISANKGLSTGRSLALSPFGMISMLAMIFLGARGSTSEQMNEVLGLDNVATFNPHLIFQNVTDTVSLARHQGIANAAFVRELFADKIKVRKLLPFYKEQAQQFYEGLVAEVNFATISDLARRRTNLLIRKQTGGRIKDFVKSNAVPLRSPLAAISANVFQTDCNTSFVSTTGRDGELYFAVSSASRLRKLIPVPATVWRSNVLAGYEPSLDATAVALGGVDKLVSTIFLLPGQQGHAAPGDTLDRLEQRLLKGAFQDGTWNKLLKVLIPRPGLELQIPKFSHRSVVNATAALKRMGLDRLFTNDADFKGINGGIGNRLFLSDVLQMNLFSTCGDENIGNGRHHVEIYPASPSLRNSQYEEHRMLDAEKKLDSDSVIDVLSKNYRSISTRGSIRNTERSENKPRLKLDQPFLYFVRHNPTGLILHTGRFNPRLL
ncbi:mucin-2 [Hylaeus volcanicus]|uniref:mucin-2 n=1 Tax=Hylaeus volcanicus TaxID=313075 RepID=UPI0023B8020F|nr:mucin-2 [Hylaeus volcanicus]